MAKKKRFVDPGILAEGRGLLLAYLTKGTIRITSKGEIVGTASDGKEVGFGDLGDDDPVFEYLYYHRTPADW